MKNKYNSKKVRDSSGKKLFDSKKEAKRFVELESMFKDGIITLPAKQVPFVILEPFITKDGEKIRGIVYKADFVYYDNKKKTLVIEDVKGTAKMYNDKGELCKSKMVIKNGKEVRKTAFTTATPDYKIKKKFVQKLYPDYLFREV
tara:strand:- start:380 stop:814 length:435 start_codon:yes stop_codon:yes gene_type:complete